MSIETAIGLETGQPYPYQRVELVEPDWTRFPGWKDVTPEEWASVQWQRAHCIKNVKQLRELMGDRLTLDQAGKILNVRQLCRFQQPAAVCRQGLSPFE
mgnify:CR=1 FL=1